MFLAYLLLDIQEVKKSGNKRIQKQQLKQQLLKKLPRL